MKYVFSAYYSESLENAIKEQISIECPEGYSIKPSYSDARILEEIMNSKPNLFILTFYYNSKIVIHPDELPALVKELMDSDSENAHSLASSICETLDIELI